MKINYKIGICIVFLFLVIYFSENVYSLGVAPARKLIDFEPGYSDEVEIKIINSGAKDTKVFVYAEGELAEFVTLENYELVFSSNDEFKTLKYKIKLPNKLDLPGEHLANIYIREVPLDYASSGSVIGASVAVVHQVVVKVPYPGKYAVIDLNVIGNDPSKVNFVVSVNNLGTQKIVNAKAMIDIYGPTNEKITSVETNLDSIDSNTRRGLSAVWQDSSINPGKYFAKVTLTYDGEVAYLEKIFDVGQMKVDILDINVKDFRLGQIAKFNILVGNDWSETISDVYVELVISETGQEIGRFKSASETIPALSKGELTAFWDTAGVEEGEYDAKVVLYFNDESIERDLRTVISLNSIKFDLFGGGAVVADTGGLDKSDVIIIALVVLVLINIGWFIYFKKFRK